MTLSDPSSDGRRPRPGAGTATPGIPRPVGWARAPFRQPRRRDRGDRHRRHAASVRQPMASAAASAPALPATLPSCVPPGRRPGPSRCRVERAIPAHAGLGSGTQLGLAVGLGLARLLGRHETAADLATLLDRGARSGIGVGAFTRGGFLVDGGKATDDAAPPPVIARLAFPAPWRLLLILDPAAVGVHGRVRDRGLSRARPVPGRALGASVPARADAAAAGAGHGRAGPGGRCPGRDPAGHGRSFRPLPGRPPLRQLGRRRGGGLAGVPGHRRHRPELLGPDRLRAGTRRGAGANGSSRPRRPASRCWGSWAVAARNRPGEIETIGSPQAG